MFECQGCGARLAGRKSRKFCSNACQRAAERKKHIALWLQSGRAIPDGKANHYVRVHIREEQRGRCAICGMAAEWNGQPLVLVLDHVNGDPEDNRRENLRLVCPNCDSQLPTFKARNRGNGRAWRRQRYAEGKSY